MSGLIGLGMTVIYKNIISPQVTVQVKIKQCSLINTPASLIQYM